MGLSMLIFRGSKVQGLESYFLVCPSFHAFIDLRTFVPASWNRPHDLRAYIPVRNFQIRGVVFKVLGFLSMFDVLLSISVGLIF